MYVVPFDPQDHVGEIEGSPLLAVPEGVAISQIKSRRGSPEYVLFAVDQVHDLIEGAPVPDPLDLQIWAQEVVELYGHLCGDLVAGHDPQRSF